MSIPRGRDRFYSPKVSRVGVGNKSGSYIFILLRIITNELLPIVGAFLTSLSLLDAQRVGYTLD